MKDIVELLSKKNKTISAMESCTGGAIANEITNIKGASKVLKFSAITYSNEFKIKMGVDKSIIDKYTVYSIQTADEMSKSITNFTNCNYGVGITGQLNEKDSSNITNENNKIYISVYDKDQNKFYNEIVYAIDISRQDNKKIIVQKIEEMLNHIISDEVN